MKNVGLKLTLLLACCLFIMASCITSNSFKVPDKAMSSEKFLNSPFGHDESIKSFIKTLPHSTKVRKLIRRNQHDDSKTDTIYQFMYKKSEIFVYKTYFNRDILMAGNIVNPEVKLLNGICTGITREQLVNSIKGFDKITGDTLKLSTGNDGRDFTFIFKNDKLKKISFSSYID